MFLDKPRKLFLDSGVGSFLLLTHTLCLHSLYIGILALSAWSLELFGLVSCLSSCSSISAWLHHRVSLSISHLCLIFRYSNLYLISFVSLSDSMICMFRLIWYACLCILLSLLSNILVDWFNDWLMLSKWEIVGII